MKGAKRINFRKATSREWSRSFKLLALSVVIGGEAVNLYADYGISGETEVRATREFEARSGALNPPSPDSLPEKELTELPVVNGVVARAPAGTLLTRAG
ncbi:MAG: hypothetical protein EBX52_06020, partial [Proteobacteria bacterium]|nr:hypothetical protein [Pseudomonadota bacterium]